MSQATNVLILFGQKWHSGEYELMKIDANILKNFVGTFFNVQMLTDFSILLDQSIEITILSIKSNITYD